MLEELLDKLSESTNDLEIVELKDKIIEELSKQNLSLHVYYTGETFFSFADLDTDDQDFIIDKMCFSNIPADQAFAEYLIDNLDSHYQIYNNKGDLIYND